MLATALEGHAKMRDLLLNGNCVGDLGAKSLLRTMRLAATHKRKLKISFRDANIHFEDRSLFNRHEPHQGTYSLQLADPYDYMIAQCLYEAYNGKLGAKFKSLQYHAPESRVWDKIPLRRPDTGDTSNAAWTPHLKAIGTTIDLKLRPAEAKLEALGCRLGDAHGDEDAAGDDDSSFSANPLVQQLRAQVKANRAELAQVVPAPNPNPKSLTSQP